MEQTPLERAARAAIEAERNMRGIDLGSPLWGGEIARAVLMAIREPSPKMILYGYDAADDCMDSDYDSNADGDREYYQHLRSDAPKPIWQAMIDTALKDE